MFAPTFTAGLTRGAAPWLPSTQEERSTLATTMTVRDARGYATKKREGKEEGKKAKKLYQCIYMACYNICILYKGTVTLCEGLVSIV